ncbi:MAG TPA: tRNA 2-thiouridine(34) synthase MnmA [Steroidobacteraceae bacterium]|nr:tRNA 2-thiouridine(34) synthase MnmA [Steroidobacteraceae bacterium]
MFSSTLLERPEPGTVIVGMSGGVDSAVSALLLRDAGFDVQALFMSNWDDDDAYCTAAADFQDARQVCEVLDLPLHRVSFAREYRERVFAHFLREYQAGRTPNPDVLCNREIKFGVCLDYMQRLGASWIATGHYARVDCDGGRPRLRKGTDPAKDQSYFLHQVAPAALGKTLFPIGHLHKQEVRRRAHAAGIPVFDKPDSTGICFIGERPFDAFLSRYLRQTPGPIEDADGTVIGEHRGLALYTLGQRSGLGIGGRNGARAAPWYVADKRPERNALIAVQDHEHPLLMSDAFDVEELHWLDAGAAGDDFAPFDCAVKTRYRQSDLPCRVEAQGASARVTLQSAARAVTPGQYAVFYDGDECLGGGVIARRHHRAGGSVPRRETPHAPGAGGIAYTARFSAEGS